MRLIGSREFAEPALRRLDPQPLDRLGRRAAGRLLVAAQKRAIAHTGARGEARRRKIGAEILAHPGVQGAEGVVALLQLQRRAELRLAAGALEKNHQLARHGERDRAPEVFLDQSEREIDTRGDARRGPDVAVADEDRIALDDHLGVAARQLGAARPMRRRAAAGEQAGGGEQQRARADRGETARPRRPLAQPAEQGVVCAGGVDAEAAGDDQRVHGGPRRRQRRDREAEAGRSSDVRRLARDDGERVRGGRATMRRKVVGAGERLQRAGHVEQLCALKGEDFDAARMVWRKVWDLCHFRQTIADYARQSQTPSREKTMTVEIGLLVFPDVQQLDLTGPYEVFASWPDARVRLVWKNREPLVSATGLRLTPDIAFDECPPLDVVCVPGGLGVNPLLADEAVLGFLRRQAAAARFVTSVCTGALVLGAAGLLRGRRATTHWASHDLLAALGAVPTQARVVRDGNLMTGGGVTAGIDFALALVAELAGAATAQAIQLQLEYAPAPPFDAGSPETAPREIVASLRKRGAAVRADREQLVAAAARRLAAR